MKKLVVTAVLMSLANGAFGQATVVFDNRIFGSIITHVYAPLPGNPYFAQIGNGSNDTPAGTTMWTQFTPIGANGRNLQYGAATTSAQLLGAPGYNAPESGLMPGSLVTTFRTGAGAGNTDPSISITTTFNNIPPDALEATLEMVAWDNSSGLYPAWTQASVAWRLGLIAAGTSGTWNQNNIGGVIRVPPFMINSADPSQHVQSFNLYFIPEPSAVALAGLGAAALFIFRRK
jgi:hypothetical protein